MGAAERGTGWGEPLRVLDSARTIAAAAAAAA
eukprot:CAMPEP_0185834658 /NCGR_PEP_ID=MMETSP1353-20130828/5883_1 /TAXON_ID=1077150 /ORGANISM="Erythrolobus australicus, Strain CCMP3124" /LENGTH=31 /DNA_ID= /DNA_START= /DNA_END= /DNA_ORIENTATION=